MVTIEMIKEAEDFIIAQWGADGQHVIETCAILENPFCGDSFGKFLRHCVAQGGDWNGMLLSGIKELWPSVWEAIPQEMGGKAFFTLCYTLLLCGVDTTNAESE